MKKYILLLMFVITVSCEKEEATPFIDASDELFIGYWRQYENTDSSRIFKRTVNLSEKEYAFGIFSDGRFLENKNAGFCGTPPITYARFEGTWLEKGEDTLLIESTYWGGQMDFDMIILSVNESLLEVRTENMRYDHEGGGEK